MSLIRKFYSHIVVKNLRLALEWYIRTYVLWLALNDSHAMVSYGGWFVEFSQLFLNYFNISQLLLTYFSSISQFFHSYFPFLTYFSSISCLFLNFDYFPLISYHFSLTYFYIISHLFPTYFSIVLLHFVTPISFISCIRI